MAESEVQLTCTLCDTELEPGSIYKFENQNYCEDCYHDNFIICDGCDETFNIKEEILETINGHIYCQSCFEDRYTYCDNCNLAVRNRDVYYIDNGDLAYCEFCAIDYAHYCDICEQYYSEHCNRHLIHTYDYKPIFEFFKTKYEIQDSLYFGIELEVECNNNNIEDISLPNFIYVKNDGSLDDGVELVTHPLTYKFIKNSKEIFKGLLKQLQNKGFTSYDTNTCGMHIHITKSKINTLQTVKIVKFFMNNERFILKLSQRKIDKFNQWSAISTTTTAVKYAKEGNRERYVAVNLLNNKTIEFRIFRGTLHFDSFMKNIEFIDALIEFTAQASLKECDDIIAFLKFIHKQKSKYRNLKNFINRKNLSSI